MDYINIGMLFEAAPAMDEFSITWATADGHWAREQRAVCTSFHAKGGTLNIRSLTTGRISTVIRATIREFAGKEAVL